MRKNPRIKWRALLACCGGVAAAELTGLIGIAHAESFPLWDGNAGNWSDPTHWIPNIVPNNGNNGNNFDVIVTGGAINLDIPVTIDSLSFSDGVIFGSSTLSTLQLLNWTGGVFWGGVDRRSPRVGSSSEGLPINSSGGTHWSTLKALLGTDQEVYISGSVQCSIIAAPLTSQMMRRSSSVNWLCPSY